MSEEEEILEKIEEYLQGRMKGEELTTFENKMSIDTLFYEKVEKQRAIQSLMVEAGLSDIRQMIQNDFSKKRVIEKRRWIGGGLLILVLSAGGIYFLNKAPQNSFDVKSQKITIDSETNSLDKKTVGLENKSSIKNNTNNIPTVKEKLVAVNNSESTHSPESFIENKKTATEIPTNVVSEKTATENIVSTIRKSDPCLEFNPIYSLKVVPSNIQQPTGKLLVATKDKNLSFSLVNKGAFLGNSFENLEAGKYDLMVENVFGCKKVQEEVVVSETHCFVLEKESFSSSSESSYKLPVEMEGLTELIIYDKKMQEMRTFKRGDSMEWEGRDKNGQLVETGLYKIVILYSNGERCSFNLTVIN